MMKSSFISSQDHDALNRSLASVNSAYTLGHSLGPKNNNIERKLSSEPDDDKSQPLELHKRDESSLQNFNGTPDLAINHTGMVQPNFGQIQDLSAIEHLNQTESQKSQNDTLQANNNIIADFEDADINQRDSAPYFKKEKQAADLNFMSN